MHCEGRSKTVRSPLGNNEVLAEAVSINQVGVTVRFGKICIAHSTFWLLGIYIGNVLASGADWPPGQKGWACYRQIGDNLHSMFTLYTLWGGGLWGKVLALAMDQQIVEGHAFMQVWMVAQDQLMGGFLMSKLNFWAVFPYVQAQLLGCFPLFLGWDSSQSPAQPKVQCPLG